MNRMVQAKPAIQQRHLDLLQLRYDLSDQPAAELMMARKKPVQDGIRVRLAEGQTWESLAGLTPSPVMTVF